MKALKNRHIWLITILFLLAILAERTAYLHFGQWRAQPVMLTRFLRLYPVYNDSGSWLHGRLGIGYVRWVLILEDVLSLAAELFLIRYIRAIGSFFGLRCGVLYMVDCGIAATVHRFFTRLRGVYVLDYLHWKGRGVFDLPDLYLFLTLAGLLVWLIPMYGRYHPYIKKNTKGMSRIQKWGWELRLSGVFLKAAFVPERRWEEMFAKWR